MVVDIDVVAQCCYCVSGGIRKLKRYRIHVFQLVHHCVSDGPCTFQTVQTVQSVTSILHSKSY